MKHKTIEKLLSPYLDGELSSNMSAMVGQHVSTCKVCSRTLEELKLISHGVKAGGDVSLSSSFVSEIVRVVRNLQEGPSAWMPSEFIARRTVFALAIIVIVLLGLTSFNTGQSDISVERFLRGEVSDSAESQILFNRGEISKEDVLMAAVSRN